MNNAVFSIFKGIGIITVVVGHSGCPLFLHNFIYLFHMALFYFVAGFFFKNKYLNTPKEFVIKRIKRLYFPWAIYGLVFVLLHNLFVHIGIYGMIVPGYDMSFYSFEDIFYKTLAVLVMRWQELLLSPFWFLKSLLLANFIFLFLLLICKYLRCSSLTEILIFIAIYMVAGLVNQFYGKLPMHLGREIIAVGLLYLGYWTGKNINKIKINGKYAVFAICILLICMQLGHIEYASSSITNIFYFTICSISGIYLVYYISLRISHFRNISKVLVFIGNHTLEIFGLHFLSFKLVTLLYGGKLDAFPIIVGHNLWPLYTFTGIILPLIAGCIYSYAKKFVLIIILNRR